MSQVTPSSEVEYSAPTTGQQRRMIREQKEFESGKRDRPPDEPIKQRLEKIVIAATSDRPNVITFVGRLQHQGVDVYPRIVGEEMKGFAFEYEGFRCRGSQLKNCSWRKLQEVRGVSYDNTRDLPILRAVGQGEKVQLLPEELEILSPELVPTVVAESPELGEVDIESPQLQDSSTQLVSISANSIECTAMFASDIDGILLSNSDRYADSEFTAQQISPTEISLRRTQDQREILRARGNGDNWEALPTESEMTSWEIHAMIALTEDLIKQSESRYWEQQQRVDIVAPIVASILNLEETTRSVGKRYIADWDEECLTLWETGNNSPIMKASWDGENQRWVERNSKLTQETTNYFEEKVLPYVQLAMLSKREREASSRFSRSKDKELEL